MTPGTVLPAAGFRGLIRLRSSLCFAAAALALFLLCIAFLPIEGFFPGLRSVTEFTQLYGYVSSADQQRAHQLTVAAVALFSAISFILANRGDLAGQVRRLGPELGGMACVVLVSVWLYAYWNGVPQYITGWAIAVSAAFLVLVLLAPRIRPAVFDRCVIAIIGACVALIVVPGLLVSPIPYLVSDANSLVQLEAHMVYLPLRGSTIAAGHSFFRELPMGYGFLMPSIMSVFEAKSGGLSLAGQLRFVQGAQVVFCLAAVAAYLAYRPRNYLGVLAALLVAGPYWISGGLGIWHANQTGFRSAGLPVGMLVLMLAGRLPPAKAAWWLGGMLGVAALMNLETAIAVAAGCFVFMVARTRSFPARMFVRMAAAAILALVAYMVLYRLALGRLPFSSNLAEIFSMLRRFIGGGIGERLFASGYAGEGYYLVPLALVMFAHAMYAVIEGFRSLGRGAVSLRTARQMAVATTLIVWFAYYFSGPNWWQIWTHLFLYGFLVIDTVDRRRFGFGTTFRMNSIAARFLRMRVAPGLFLLLLLFALVIPHTTRHLFKYTSEFLHPDWMRGPHDAAELSGVLLPRDKAEQLAKKAARLRELYAGTKGNLVYLTFNMTFMPHLSKVFQPAPYRDPFGEIPGDRAFEESMRGLLARRPAIILVDTEDGPLALSGPRRDYQERLRRAIQPAYGVTGIEDGWQIWQPTATR